MLFNSNILRGTVTVQIPDRPGGRYVVEKEVLADPNDKEFMRAFRNEVRLKPFIFLQSLS